MTPGSLSGSPGAGGSSISGVGSPGSGGGGGGSPRGGPCGDGSPTGGASEPGSSTGGFCNGSSIGAGLGVPRDGGELIAPIWHALAAHAAAGTRTHCGLLPLLRAALLAFGFALAFESFGFALALAAAISSSLAFTSLRTRATESGLPMGNRTAPLLVS